MVKVAEEGGAAERAEDLHDIAGDLNCVNAFRSRMLMQSACVHPLPQVRVETAVLSVFARECPDDDR